MQCARYFACSLLSIFPFFFNSIFQWSVLRDGRATSGYHFIRTKGEKTERKRMDVGLCLLYMNV